ncbi:hypothetical protein RDI58_013331 [Solanum bulbocastanum]|uniref:Uncharacterized protein n=1 Tax=Solanum bulbocastanum TaxID=147425 RepID=A0AAN8TTE7_SOLBU
MGDQISESVKKLRGTANSLKFDISGSTKKNDLLFYKLDHKLEVARAYDIAAEYYKMMKNLKEARSCLEKAAHLFLDIGRLNATRGHYQEIAKLYEHENNMGLAIVYYQKTADLFQSMDLTSSANQCRQKIAEYSAKVGKYHRSIMMFEEIATYSIRNNLLKYGVKRASSECWYLPTLQRYWIQHFQGRASASF